MMFGHQERQPRYISNCIATEAKERQQRKQNGTNRHQQSRIKVCETVKSYCIAAEKFFGITSPVPN